ncbi:Panacea domain-containing protein [Haloimpatiens sp. FM7330]|uniref:Panacea domain-containing protein n=1 Tax=Haloimpatiens sp. FM7330 TaxID=3298610 RepID=UPI003641428A
MYQHLIIIYSDYSYGKRIAYHNVYESVDKIKSFFKMFEQLKGEFRHINFGFHHVQTNNKSWKSVFEYDGFFSDVELVSSLEDFKKLVKNDTTIDPVDIAKLIVSRCNCTQLQAQKLIYFFWCEYHRKYKKDIWKEDFKAWTYGPVIFKVYKELKEYGRDIIKLKDKDSIYLEVYSRITKIPEYNEILMALDETIRKYGNCSATKLVDQSHIKGGPWDLIYQNGQGKGNIIPKNLIKEYVKNMN